MYNANFVDFRDVNCISCDAKAIMCMDPPITLPASKPLPPTLSMKPYLSYELGTISNLGYFLPKLCR